MVRYEYDTRVAPGTLDLDGTTSRTRDERVREVQRIDHNMSERGYVRVFADINEYGGLLVYRRAIE